MADLDRIRARLGSLSPKEIRFNEPHVTERLALRGSSHEEVIETLLDLDRLVFVYEEKGRKGDTVHCLYFKRSNTRTEKIPVIFTEKGLLVLTYILRYRKWQGMVK